MVKYFPRYLITTAKYAVKIEPIKYLGKYMPICLILPCAEKSNLYVTKKHLYILHKCFLEEIIHEILAFLTPLMLNQKRLLWTFCIDRGFACE